MTALIQQTSLQKQLLIRLGWVLCVLWLLGLLLAGLVLRQALNQSFDSALQETAERILPLAVVESYNREQDQVIQQLPALRAHDEYLTYQVQTADGQVLLQSHAARQQSFIQNTPLTEGFTDHAGHRLYITSAVSGHFFIQVAEPLAQRRAAISNSLLALALPLLLIAPLSLLLAALLVRAALQPVRAYGAALEQRGAADLSPIQDSSLPQELEPMVQAVNQLMARLRKALDAERHFTANAAHELRTPLATVMAQLQRLQKKLTDADALARAEQMAVSLRQLTAMADKLLQLARAEGAGLQATTEQDIGELLQLLVNEWQTRAAGRLQLDLPQQPVLLPVDVDALALLVSNLLENAIKHGSPDQPINLRLNPDACLSVINHCATLSASQLDHLQERFYRGTTQSSGAGLGLAIAASLVQGMGGRMQLFSPARGQQQGFEVQVQLPVTPLLNEEQDEQ